MDIHVYLHNADDPGSQLDGLVKGQRAILKALGVITTLERQVREDLTPIQNAAARIESAVDDTGTALRDLAAQIADNANDPAAVQALADQLNAQADELEADVAATTTPPVEEPPA